MSKIGLFGGTFNPPTTAHINLANKIIEELELEKIVFMPMGDSYKKEGIIEAKHRYKMLQIAVKGSAKLQVSDLEISTEKSLDAIDAFKLIQNEYKNNELFFIMGADNFKNIEEWKSSEELITNYNYIVIERENINLKDIISKSKSLKENEKNFYIVENKEYESISASTIRKNIQSIEIKKYVAEEILDYINNNGLYTKKL
ncbi:MAG: nicotinate (nicotinamide) nucleotide adenylyltransferase [Lachnospiraceae bacterium]|jgi:nicotinate-nucleotide adenylyltransferase|nr:nicotinate (nicotinamide) nucleotide adenylyltransferase [Lachnospiraceae bacterium]